jgi:L-xylulokinase
MALLLGIDNGLTVTKAVIFEEDGTPVAVARRRVPQSLPQPRHVERDMDGLWSATAEAIREAIAKSGRRPGDIKAVAATAHGDGVYLLDRNKRPLGAGILSLDSRAGAIVEAWERDGVARKALELTGQTAHASAPSALLAHIRENEPERYAAIGHVFTCKDWLRFCLTGVVGTDLTEASTSFTDVRSQAYDPAALEVFGLGELWPALAPAARPDEIVGTVTRVAAEATGLVEGTPVAAGLHDVTASALGIGGHAPGTLAVVAGTYSINEVVTEAPMVDSRWFCRNGIRKGWWNSMAISPASTANYDWFLDNFCRDLAEKAEREGTDIHALLRPELERALEKPSDILFHPFLFGSPFGSQASAGFFGVHGWHERGDLLKAVLEGLVFNHKLHIDDLLSAVRVERMRISGGGARSPILAQMFADATGLAVDVSSADEAAAWGAALVAGAAIGLYPSPEAGAAATTRILRSHDPDPVRRARLAERYDLYRRLADAMAPQWRAIEDLARRSRETDG